MIRLFSSALDLKDLWDNSDRYMNAFTKYRNFTQSPNDVKNLSLRLNKTYKLSKIKNRKSSVWVKPVF